MIDNESDKEGTKIAQEQNPNENESDNCRIMPKSLRDSESNGNTSTEMTTSHSSSNNTKLSGTMKKTLGQILEQVRQSLLDRICEVLESNESCDINLIVEEYETDYPWMTRFIINEAQEKYRLKLEQQVKVKLEVNIEETSQQNKKGDPSSICSMSIDTMDNGSLSSNCDDINGSTSGSTEKRDGRKKRKKGETRRKFATLYQMPQGAEHAVDITHVCHSVSVLNRLEQSENKFLAHAYQQMNDAKQEYDDAKALLDQYESQHQQQLEIMANMEEKMKNQLQIVKSKEELIQKASDYVTEQELKVDCPWNTNYRKLCQYKETHGNIDLPTRCQDDKDLDSLCCWVQAQKQKYQDYREGCKITFKPYRILLLEKLGIEWNVRNNLWNKHFETLIKFKEEFGHVLVPVKTPPPAYKELAAWVVYQRDQYKSIMDETVRKRRPVKPAASLTPDRIKKLIDVGFVFSIYDERWAAMYLELKYSNRNYSSFKKTAPKLHNWVERQRYEYELYHNGQRQNKRCRLTPERIRLLNELDFPWRACDEIKYDREQNIELTSAAKIAPVQSNGSKGIQQDEINTSDEKLPSTQTGDDIIEEQSFELKRR